MLERYRNVVGKRYHLSISQLKSMILMFIFNENLNDLLFFLSLSSAMVFLSLMLVSYGLQMRRLTILCVFLLMISSVTAVMHFWVVNPCYKDGKGVVSRKGFDLSNFFCWPVACPLLDIICAVDIHVQIELQDAGYNIDDFSSSFRSILFGVSKCFIYQFDVGRSKNIQSITLVLLLIALYWYEVIRIWGYITMPKIYILS